MNTPIRKRLLTAGLPHPEYRDDASDSLNLAVCATIAFSSEDSDHRIENLLDSRGGVGGTHWAAAREDATEQILLEFDAPLSISRMVYEVEETRLERTQEIRIEASCDAGRTYRQLLVQEYAFSPRGATFQREDLPLRLEGVSHLRLTIVPNKNGSGTATLTSFRLYP